MTPPRRSGLNIVSGATLAGVSFDVPVNPRAVTQYLERLGPLTVAERSDASGPRITCELWTVTDGRAMPGGIDQHALVAKWTGFRMASMGPYHELLVGIPDVRVGDDPTRYVAVLGMITDSPLARSIDGWFGYGYAKQLGRFVRPHDGYVEVHVGGKIVLTAAFHLDEGQPASGARAWLDERWEQPLLGGLHERSLRASSLERRIDPGARCTGICGDVSFSWPEIPVLPGGRHALAESSGAGAAAFANVASRISRPARAG